MTDFLNSMVLLFTVLVIDGVCVYAAIDKWV